MFHLAVALGVVGVWVSFGASAQRTHAIPALACVAPEKLGCGCRIRLASPPCTNQTFARQPHLFTELEPDAPLSLVLDGKERTLQHISHSGSSEKGEPRGLSSDLYRTEDLEVEVRYTKAPSTCPKNRPDGCEYTDVGVEVILLQPGKKAWIQRGTGTCGC